jgi:hypothetical protein
MSYTDHVKQDLMAVGKTDLKQHVSFLEKGLPQRWIYSERKANSFGNYYCE